MKKIIKYHSSYITNEIYDDFYMCPYCKEYVIRSHFDFCPICGEKIEFQTEKDYENELLLNLGLILFYIDVVGIKEKENIRQN